MTIETTYERLCKGLSGIIQQEKKQKKIFEELKFAGIKDNKDIWIGKRILSILLAMLIGALLPWTVGKFFGIIAFESIPFIAPLFYSISIAAIFGATAFAIFYLHLYYQIEERAAMVEEILPDFLMLVASNINAGMTPVLAFKNSARKEFGPLSEEIKAAAAKSLGTESFTESLADLSKKIKSKTLQETVSFFSQSLRSGGHLAKLLETSAFDLRQTQELKKELVSSTRMYTIFVAFIVVIATPVLLSISVQFLSMIKNLQAQSLFDTNTLTTLTFLSAELKITPEFMWQTAITLLLTNAILSSIFIGTISSGKAKIGLKNFPLLLTASIIVFLITNNLLGALLGPSMKTPY